MRMAEAWDGYSRLFPVTLPEGGCERLRPDSPPHPTIVIRLRDGVPKGRREGM